MVTLVPQGGLGNRIRSIRAAARLANARGQKFKIIWISVCDCGFGDIFHDIRGIKYGFEVECIKGIRMPSCFWGGNIQFRRINQSIYDIVLKEPCYDNIVNIDILYYDNILAISGGIFLPVMKILNLHSFLRSIKRQMR